MYKIWGVLGTAVVGVVFLYISSSVFDVLCIGKNSSCKNISQVQADDEEKERIDIQNWGREDYSQEEVSIKTLSHPVYIKKNEEEETLLKAQQVVSERAEEQRKMLEQAQRDQQLEAEKQVQYKAQLLEDGKIIVAEYEAERQEKLKGE
jgi:hypothetical protein